MEFIKQWCICVCSSLLIAAVFSLLAPNGSMKTFFKVMISVFIFVSFILPFQNFRGAELDFSDFGIESQLESSQNESVSAMLENEISALLSANDIVGASVSVKSSYNAENGEIDVRDIQVAVGDECDEKEVETLIFNELGLNARVIKIGS